MSVPRLGPYDLLEPVGAGGMGQVYRARDSRLGRDVAIKLLRSDDRHDADLLARFEREAQALAALNHPHIASIHDVVEADGRRGIVMEYVAGRTLTEVMGQGPLAARTTLGYAIQICDALAAAHAAGIVHRDLKPANIIVTGAGPVKVLDFGIAKLMSADQPATASANTQAPLTAERTVVGTVGYMSPEQVHGRTLDARSDIFSLGVLLYEMLAGRRAFEAESTAGLLSAVLRDDPPPLRTIDASVPRSVERITARCLEKEPGRRYQTAADLMRALEDARDDLTAFPGAAPATSIAGPPSPSAQAPLATLRRRVLRPLGYIATGAAVSALLLLAAGAFDPPVVLTPRHTPFITEQAGASQPAWARDGQSIAYLAAAENGTQQLFVRTLDGDQPTQLTRRSDSVEGGLGWSPDGTRVYFYLDGDLASVGIAGGEPTLIAQGSDAGFAVGPDGRTVVSARRTGGLTSLSVIDLATGAETRLDRPGLPTPLIAVASLAFSPDGAQLAMTAGTTANTPQGLWIIPWPEGAVRQALVGAPIDLGTAQGIGWMPDSRRVVFNANPAHELTSRLFIGDTISGAVHQITVGVNSEVSPTVSSDGSRIAFVSRRLGRDLLALPVDGSTPNPLLQSSRNESFPDMSASGALAYVTDADGWPAVRLRMGTDTWSRRMGRNITNVAQVRLSPDGQRVSVDDTSSAEHSIVIYAVAGGAPVRLDRESTDQHGASWSPDGNWIAYRRLLKNRWELVKAPVGGGSHAVLAGFEAIGGGGTTDWSPSGSWIGHTMEDDGVHLVAPDGNARRVLAGPRPAAFRFSRNGSRLLAIRRGEGRRWELATWDVDSGRTLRVVALPLAASTEIQGMSLSADESQVIVGAGTPTSDIWLLEQFEPPIPRWRRWMRW
jgi:Tol biopolymer transport system component/predicted Ser/Thr protein kinase